MMVLILQHININNSLRGLKLFKAQNNLLTDGAPYYKASCRILNLKHGLYSSEIRNLMERVIQYVKDGAKLFDN